MAVETVKGIYIMEHEGKVWDAFQEAKDAKFPLGTYVRTPGAQEALIAANVKPSTLLKRHQAGDWGDLCEDDKTSNDEALTDPSPESGHEWYPGRLFSSYNLPENPVAKKVWIITEWDRSRTTILLPSEY